VYPARRACVGATRHVCDASAARGMRPSHADDAHEVCTPSAGARRRAYHHHFCAAVHEAVRE
jgi:hypothetical protein